MTWRAFACRAHSVPLYVIEEIDIMRFRLLLVVAALLCGLQLSGCASEGSGLPPLPQQAGGNTEAGYRLGPGDKLRLTVFGAEDLSGDFTVGDNGMVNLPLIGEVKAANLSTPELATSVQRRLSDGYMRDPKVSIQVASYRPFFILGEVTKPGQYDYVNGMTVVNAIALGGGYTYRAQQGYAVVSRAGKEYRAKPTDRILPDDILRVPERYF
ncbi:MAG TPA: polysaccharide biosynthesis/export family protein [Stellaceae bacterium]